MTRTPSARLTRGDYEGPFAEFRRLAEQRIETAALIAVDQGTRRALQRVRSEMQGAGLGRLGNALGSKSDKAIHRTANGFSASGVVFVRSGSERSRGAIEAYTSGADIRPVRGRWLWIATDQVPRVTGRYRMTPALWRQNGFDTKIGPLVLVKASNGNPLLIVRNVGVSASGKSRSARSLTRKGMPRKGQVHQEFIVAFIGIPRTSRAGRVNVPAIMQSVAGELPALFHQALGRI